MTLQVRVVPRAAREGFGGVRRTERGDAELVLRVTAPPVEGAANEAVVRLVAKALGVARSAVTVAAGQTGRSKRLDIAGDPAALGEALERILGGRNTRGAGAGDSGPG